MELTTRLGTSLPLQPSCSGLRFENDSGEASPWATAYGSVPARELNLILLTRVKPLAVMVNGSTAYADDE